MAKDRIDGNELAGKLVETAQAAEDPIRQIGEMVLNFVAEAQASATIGAEPYERTEERVTHRNGHRDRRFDTRLGTLNLRIPKLREGGFVPSFIEHRKRSEQALISVIQEAVVQGVSTRKIESVLAAFGIAGVSAGQVSQLCAALDEKVRDFQERRLGEFRYVWVDALYEKVREDHRVESMAVVIATGVNPQGRREVLGFDVIPTESEEGWTQFFKALKERGLTGVQLVISDDHSGLRPAAKKVLKAEWQRCKVHFYRNVLAQVPKRSQAEVSEAMKPCSSSAMRRVPRQRRPRCCASFRRGFRRPWKCSRAASTMCSVTCTIRRRTGRGFPPRIRSSDSIEKFGGARASWASFRIAAPACG